MQGLQNALIVIILLVVIILGALWMYQQGKEDGEENTPGLEVNFPGSGESGA